MDYIVGWDELFILIREPASNLCEWMVEQRQKELIKGKIYLEQQKTKLWRDKSEKVLERHGILKRQLVKKNYSEIMEKAMGDDTIVFPKIIMLRKLVGLGLSIYCILLEPVACLTASSLLFLFQKEETLPCPIPDMSVLVSA